MTVIKHVLHVFVSMLLFRVNGSAFSQSNFVVWFDPYVSTQDIGFAGRYDINGLIPMITKISSKFNKIMIGDMGRYDRGLSTESISHSLIAPAVATFNKFPLKPQQSPMEVLMTFNFSDPLSNVSRTQLGIVKRLADKANRIFPGTVQTLYLDYPHLTDATVEVTKQYLETALKFLNATFYELGARLPIQNCLLTRTPNYIIPILPYVRKILFYRPPTSQDLVRGAERSFSGDLFIPSAVAKFNENLTQKQQLMEVMMVFDLIPEYGHLSTSFSLTKKLADEANAIQPGTVKKLYFVIIHLNDEIAGKNSKAFSRCAKSA
ncbi:unnamed protein product [Orchesella dallaii]|uniref:Uncharacterized protein n=1 Tax=Orchesella dallaii TaxID=48710 RepID=A0ABP1RV54_9HEXA